MLRLLKSYWQKIYSLGQNLGQKIKTKISLKNKNLRLSPETEWLLKPKTSMYVLWLKRLAILALAIYSLSISYAWYQNQQILQNAGGYLSERLKNLQTVFSSEHQKAQSALAIEKKSQDYLLAEIKKLRQENIELQKRLAFFEDVDANASLKNKPSEGARTDRGADANSNSNSNSNIFKVTKSQAVLINTQEKINGAHYIPNLLFKDLPQNILQIKAWLIQPNLKAFEATPTQFLDVELELRYQINNQTNNQNNSQIITERYPEKLEKQTQAPIISLFKNFELNAYRAWAVDVELPQAAKIQSIKLIFKHPQQNIWLNLAVENI